MPTYEYECEKCGVFEVSRSIKAAALAKCPTCRRKIRRLISSTSFQLKGSGWYVTDYARAGDAKKDKGADGASESASESKGDAKSDAQGDAKGDAKTESKTDAKPESKAEPKPASKGDAQSGSKAAPSSPPKAAAGAS